MNKTIIYCILSALLAVLISSFFFKHNEEIDNINYQDSLNLVVKNYELNSVKFKAKEDSLKKKIASISKNLSFQKTKYNSVKDTALSLIKSAPKECDSLAVYTDKLIQEGFRKDSLFEAKIDSQDSLINTKEARVVNCEKSFVLLQKVTQSTIDNNMALRSDISSLQKKLSRNKTGFKIASGLAILMSGLFLLK